MGLKNWLKRDKEYSWMEYWIDGKGGGFLKLPIILLCIGCFGLLVSMICLIVLTFTVSG